MANVRNHSQKGNNLASTDQRQAQKSGAAHASFGIVEESVKRRWHSAWIGTELNLHSPVNSRVGQLLRVLFKEKVRVEPAYVDNPCQQISNATETRH